MRPKHVLVLEGQSKLTDQVRVGSVSVKRDFYFRRCRMKMNTKVPAFVALIAGLLTMGSPLFAHHGDAAYDTSKPVVLKDAVVTEYDWINPHALIKVDFKDENGKVQHWISEIGSTPSMSL